MNEQKAPAGRVVASNGYILVYVGKNHHLADVRGYAYEHRVIAEISLGRALQNGEEIHHIDGNKQNNNPENLEVMSSRSDHLKKHHNIPHNKRPENPIVECECGCGATFPMYLRGVKRRYISGHNKPPHPRPKLTEQDVLEILEFAKAKMKHKDIAKIFGVSQPFITRIINGQRRKDG